MALSGGIIEVGVSIVAGARLNRRACRQGTVFMEPSEARFIHTLVLASCAENDETNVDIICSSRGSGSHRAKQDGGNLHRKSCCFQSRLGYQRPSPSKLEEWGYCLMRRSYQCRGLPCLKFCHLSHVFARTVVGDVAVVAVVIAVAVVII
jgi:hypothetical protein